MQSPVESAERRKRRTRQWDVTQEEWDRLLDWLNPDHEQAAQMYEEIRNRLIRWFELRECNDGEALADEIFNRLARKLPHIIADYVGDPIPYFYGIARLLLQEYQRRPVFVPLFPHAALTEEKPEEERGIACLHRCLNRLKAEERELLLRYYQAGDYNTGSAARQKLAEELGITNKSLRLRVYRIRARLLECARNCHEKKS
jgi:RNA polymerase sigma factor (sigma-70 family)